MLESSQHRRETAVRRNPMIRPDEAVSRAQETRMKGTELTGKQQLAADAYQTKPEGAGCATDPGGAGK